MVEGRGDGCGRSIREGKVPMFGGLKSFLLLLLVTLVVKLVVVVVVVVVVVGRGVILGIENGLVGIARPMRELLRSVLVAAPWLCCADSEASVVRGCCCGGCRCCLC